MTSFPSKNKRTEIPPLLNPPLLEAIFELRWELQGDPQTSRYRDPSYPMMYGRLYEKFKKEFPKNEDLQSTQMHPEATPFVVRHRLRKEDGGWPLVQVGPGILTLNEAKDYSWSKFSQMASEMVEAISDLYPPGDFPLNFIKAELRFVNGIHFDPTRSPSLAWMRDKLHTTVQLPERLFSFEGLKEQAIGFGLNVALPLDSISGVVALSTNLGQVDNMPAFITQTMIQSVGESAPQDRRGFEVWLDEAHRAAEHVFLSLCDGDLIRQFGEEV